jgi:hypothetical protein
MVRPVESIASLRACRHFCIAHNPGHIAASSETVEISQEETSQPPHIPTGYPYGVADTPPSRQPVKFRCRPQVHQRAAVDEEFCDHYARARIMGSYRSGVLTLDDEE